MCKGKLPHRNIAKMRRWSLFNGNLIYSSHSRIVLYNLYVRNLLPFTWPVSLNKFEFHFSLSMSVSFALHCLIVLSTQYSHFQINSEIHYHKQISRNAFPNIYRGILTMWKLILLTESLWYMLAYYISDNTQVPVWQSSLSSPYNPT